MHDISDDYPELYDECVRFSEKIAHCLKERSKDYDEFVMDARILIGRMEEMVLRIPKENK